MADEIEDQLVIFLQALSPAPAGGRIYPLLLPEKSPTLPAITFQRIFTERGRTLAGPDGHVRPLVQYDCWATTLKGARDVATALRAALDGYTGLAGSIKLRDSKLENQQDFNEDGARYRRVLMEFSFSHTE